MSYAPYSYWPAYYYYYFIKWSDELTCREATRADRRRLGEVHMPLQGQALKTVARPRTTVDSIVIHCQPELYHKLERKL